MKLIESIRPQTIFHASFVFFIGGALLLGHRASANTISVDLSKPNSSSSAGQNSLFCKTQDGILGATNSEAVLVPPGTDDIVDLKGAIADKSTAGSAATTIDVSSDDAGRPLPAQLAYDHRCLDLPPGCESLEVPSGNIVSFHVYAKGVQIYKWDDTTSKWMFVAPSASLYANALYRGLVGTHYAGPTWESTSGSTVVGHRLQGCSPDPTAIPWLLLEAVTSQGPGPFANTTYIQRVSTTGGLAPDRQGSPGEIAEVPYTAQYYFYRAQCSA